MWDIQHPSKLSGRLGAAASMPTPPEEDTVIMRTSRARKWQCWEPTKLSRRLLSDRLTFLVYVLNFVKLVLVVMGDAPCTPCRQSKRHMRLMKIYKPHIIHSDEKFR